jgi:quercetin dioxygenase-like cupin family protein
MAFVELERIEERSPFPGYRGRFVHSEQMTFAHWTIDEGAPLPEHAHPAEQVVNVIEGRYEITIGGETRVLDPGTVALIPSNIPHSGRAVTDCRIIDVFHPVREEYR